MVFGDISYSFPSCLVNFICEDLGIDARSFFSCIFHSLKQFLIFPSTTVHFSLEWSNGAVASRKRVFALSAYIWTHENHKDIVDILFALISTRTTDSTTWKTVYLESLAPLLSGLLPWSDRLCSRGSIVPQISLMPFAPALRFSLPRLNKTFRHWIVPSRFGFAYGDTIGIRSSDSKEESPSVESQVYISGKRSEK